MSKLLRALIGVGGAAAAVVLSKKENRDKLKMNIVNINPTQNLTSKMLKISLHKSAQKQEKPLMK